MLKDGRYCGKRVILRLAIGLVISLVVLVAGCGKKSGIEGKVVDGKGTPMAGVKVVAKQVQPIKGYEQFEATTGSDGGFRLPKLFPASEYVLTTYTDGGEKSASVKIESGLEGQTKILSEPIALRFMFSKDGATVRDTKTGLMWMQNAAIAGRGMSWGEAMAWVRGINIGGFKDWRLPTVNELGTMAKAGKAGEFGMNSLPMWFNANGFSNVQAIFYWSSTTYADDTAAAWCVLMRDGSVNWFGKNAGFYVWPVRSGQ